MSIATLSHIDLTCPLFIPGNRAEMLAKVERYDASGYVPDLEDSVPVGNKDQARNVTSDALPSLHAIGKPVVPRVNSLPTGLTVEDLDAVVTPYITAISIGKIGGPDEIAEVDGIITYLESKRGLRAGNIGILPWLETANAIVNAYAICASSARVRWAAFGAEDFSADMGINREVDEDRASNTGRLDEYGEASLIYPRSAIAIAARAANVQALDTPYVKFRDGDGLNREAGLARRLGYSGKFAIHPAQIDGIKSAFYPSDMEIDRANRVIDAAERAEHDGLGSLSLDGEMIDAPVVARARNVLLRAGLS